MLDYRIKTLIAVVEKGTLLKAADSLGLTQSAVSQHIKALEYIYGVPLFEHRGRKLSLTGAGNMVLEAAKQVRNISAGLEKGLQNMLGSKKRYTIGATLTIGEYILPSYIGKYRQINPQLELVIRIENTREILRLLDEGTIDLAMVEGPFPKDKYYSELFIKDEMVFIGTDAYIPPGCSAAGLKELSGARLILRELGSGTRYYWEEYLKEHSVHLPEETVIMEVGSLSAIKSLVEAGYGCSVMSRTAIEKELILGSIKTCPLAFGPLIRELYFVYSSSSPAAFIDSFKQFVKLNDC